MKKLFFISSILLSLSAFSLIQVGEQGQCASLTTISPNGQEANQDSCATNHENGFVLLDFVSATCSFCQKSLPEISQFAIDMQNDLTIRQIGLDRNPDLLRDYWKQNQSYMKFDLAIDSNRFMRNAYRISGVPSYVLIDKNKKVVFAYEGVLHADEYYQIRKIVQSSP